MPDYDWVGPVGLVVLGGLLGLYGIVLDVRDRRRERAAERRSRDAETERWWRARHDWQ